MMIPRIVVKALATLVLTQVFAFAATISATNTINPANGAACNPGTSVPPAGGFSGNCIDGAPIQFDIFSVSLTSPTSPGSNWKLDILTNYGQLGSNPVGGVCPSGPGAPQGCIPGGSTSIPTYSYEGKQFGMADFMIQSGSLYYAVVLTPHDGYTAGSLYQVTPPVGQSGFLTSFQVMNPQGIIDIPRGPLPALLKAGGTKIGNGSLTAGPNGGDGISAALYKISVDFAAPVSFLSSGSFTIYAASYVCDNGYITATFDSVPPPPDTQGVPEPSTFSLVIPIVLALGVRQYRKS